MLARKPFDHSAYAWKSGIDYRKKAHLYQVGKGEQGVLICEPYKSEIGPYWRFKNPADARRSSKVIYQLFLSYLAAGDFVGADLARKYLQMGYTRARRYANYKSGRKYRTNSGEALPRGTGDPVKAQAATLFYEQWRKAEANPRYAFLKKSWKDLYG